MNKRKSVLELVRKSNNKTNKQSIECRTLQKVVEVMSRHYEICDMDNGTIHSKVFSMLYLSPKHYTYKSICETQNISKNTLIRYISKYDELALKILRRLNL